MTNNTKIELNDTSRQENEPTELTNLTENVVTASKTHTQKRYFGLSIRHWLFLYGLFVATVLTWVANHNFTQYKNHGPVAFQDGFPGDLTQWTRRGGWENVLFEKNSIKVQRDVDKVGIAVRTFALMPSENRATEKLKVTALVNTLKKKPSTDHSAGGAVMIWLQDDSDKVVKYLNIGKLDGQTEHYEVSRVVNLAENITRFSIVLTNKQTSAEFALVDASVVLITELSMFQTVRVVVFFVWTIIFLIALYYLFAHASRAMFAVIATVISLTIIGVLMPETMRSGAVKPVYETLQTLTGVTNESGLVYAFKVGHFIFFFLSTLILLLYRKSLNLLAWEIFLLVTLFAIATEGLQLYLLDRSTRITDLIIDFSAIVIGTILAALIVAISAIRSKKTKSTPAAL